MRKLWFSVMLGAAALLSLPTLSSAQHGGHGGHAGGHASSGGHASGSIHSGGHTGGSFHSGGIHSDSFHNGNFHNGNFHNGFYIYGGLYPGYPSYYRYGYSPSYSSLYYDTPYYSSVPSYSSYYYSPPAYDPAPVTVAPTVDASASQATVEIRVPADAEIWIDGSPTKQRGESRSFVSPPLQAGRVFTYELRARWMQEGKPVEQTRQVQIEAGRVSTVDFLAR